MPSALILVDLQNDFAPGGALAVPDGDRVVPVANRLMPHFDIVAASQDWHPTNHASFADNQPGHEIGDVIDLGGMSQILWPVHCVQGTEGAELLSGLDSARIDRVFRKGMDPEVDSYSAFFDNARRSETGLADYLRERGVEDVYLMGLATDYCVKCSVLDACDLGFNTHLVLDGCRGVERKPKDVETALKDMQHAGAKIVESHDILAD